MPYDDYMLYIKEKDTEKCCGYVTLSPGEASRISWSFDWDDDDFSDPE